MLNPLKLIIEYLGRAVGVGRETGDRRPFWKCHIKLKLTEMKIHQFQFISRFYFALKEQNRN